MTNDERPRFEVGAAPVWQRRRWQVAALVAFAVLLIVVSGCSWYLTDRIEAGALQPDHGEKTFGLEVMAVSEGAVTLRAFDDSNANRGGSWALQWRTADDEGWVQVGPIVASDPAADETVRPMTALGEPPPVGAEGRLHNYALLGTPLDLGLRYEAIEYDAALGPAGAWLVCGGRSRWLIHLHGRNGDPREVLRMLPTVSGLGFTTLSISYTNDLDAEPSESGRYGWGASEWLDVVAAVRFAQAQGAEEIMVAGHSMGGGIVASFLVESELASELSGAILDAPMLDFRRTVALGLEDGGVPGALQGLPIWLFGTRFDIDWDALDYAGRSAEFETPMLIFHGTDDRLTPIEASEELAERRPDLVTYERFEGVHHTGAWNVDPERYEDALGAFVEAQLGVTSTFAGCTVGG